MRNIAVVLPLFSLPLLAGVFMPANQSRSLQSSSVEAHDGLTISAQPWLDAAKYKEKFPKKSPYSAGIVAIQVVIRNDSDESIKIDNDQIRLLVSLGEDDRQQLPALTAEEVADQVLLKSNGKDPTQRRPKIPLPMGGKDVGRGKDWNALEGLLQNAAIPSGVVAAHSNMQGLLYFDLRGQWELLNSAHLYFPSLTGMKTNRTLLYFEIDLSSGTRR
jgi:hypothetical protein